ncbi:hypothetical protein HSR121_1175 [Halapricum desulfuricans]|uniref:Uncharacterized protein n=1 Tax=Halapricum desulfuricans TaxID=2841257 RepID=A0A897MY06_9EURY|nr:hypothetical protein HSR121_1175 [Halapricum desulfuricans]
MRGGFRCSGRRRPAEIDEETAESFKKFTQGTAPDKDREKLMDAVGAWIDEPRTSDE